MTKLRVDSTPNPNSIKVTLDKPVLDSGSFSAASSEEAESNELARKLFALGSISNVFMINNFISVNKAPGADWGELQPKVEEVIRAQFED